MCVGVQLPPTPHPPARPPRRVLVGAPLQRVGANKTGAVYHCRHRSGECREVPVTGEPPPTPPQCVCPPPQTWVPQEGEGEEGVTRVSPAPPEALNASLGLALVAGDTGALVSGAGGAGGGATWVTGGGGGGLTPEQVGSGSGRRRCPPAGVTSQM